MSAPDYTPHLDSLFDPLKPILGGSHLEARDNLVSVAGGGVDAPRILLAALERLDAGDTLRSSSTVDVPDGEFASAIEFNVMQLGDIRCTCVSNSNLTLTMRVMRTRNGVTDTLSTNNTRTPISVDFAVRPGDLVVIEGSGNQGAGNITGEILTDGASIWPGSAMPLELTNV